MRARPAAGWPLRLLVLVAALAVLAAGTLVVSTRDSGDDDAPAATLTMAPRRPADPLVIQVLPTAPPETEAPTTTTPPTTAPAAAAPVTESAASSASAPSGDGSIYGSLGAWVDVFDFHPPHTNGNPSVTPASVDRMAAVGVKTLYLQAARPEDERAPGDLVDPSLLSSFVRRAHANDMHVVGWYLPHLADVADDMRHLQAMVDFSVDGRGFDSLSLDIEWRNSVPDHAERSAQLVDLSQRLRDATAGQIVSATVMPPVVTDVINPSFWPGFPWAELAPLYDVWLPMSYWTNRSSDSPYRDAYRYTVDNVNLLRQNLGDPNAAVHPIGGIGDKATLEDYEGFAAAARDTGCIGLSNYDWGTTDADAWPILRG